MSATGYYPDEVPGGLRAGLRFDWRGAMERVRDTLPCQAVAVVTSLPRGGLHIAQAISLPSAFRRAHAERFHAEDCVVWQAMRQGRTIQSNDNTRPPSAVRCPHLDELLIPQGLKHEVAAPVCCPIFRGYPGALVAWRNTVPFTNEQIGRLTNLAQGVQAKLEQLRANRQADQGMQPPAGCPNPGRRQFIFNGKGEFIPLASDCTDQPDPELVHRMRQWVRAWMLSSRSTEARRLLLTDSRQEIRLFRVLPWLSYPALGDGPFVFFYRQPRSDEWAVVQAEDLRADVELARLIPVVHYIHRRFADAPSLEQAARRARLSPFHFHRRFTDAIGVTPKQFLLQCQMDFAKRRLREQRHDIAEISRDCGFLHQSHFSSRFKQATGQTPTQWRRRHPPKN